MVSGSGLKGSLWVALTFACSLLGCSLKCPTVAISSFPLALLSNGRLSLDPDSSSECDFSKIVVFLQTSSGYLCRIYSRVESVSRCEVKMS